MREHLARWARLDLSPADRAILDQMEEEMKNEKLRKIVWDAVEARIDDAFPDGIAANGEYSESVYSQQRSYINGMRAARLAIITALEAQPPILTRGVVKTAEPISLSD